MKRLKILKRHFKLLTVRQLETVICLNEVFFCIHELNFQGKTFRKHPFENY